MLQGQYDSSQKPHGPPPRGYIELTDARGIHQEATEGGLVMDAERPALLLFSTFLVRPDTQRIRFVVDGKLLEELVRPAPPPRIEALIVRRAPLQVALRVEGAGHLTTFLLFQTRNGSSLGAGSIEPGAAGFAPCWRMLPNASKPAKYDPQIALEVRVSNVFNIWTFRYGEAQTHGR